MAAPSRLDRRRPRRRRTTHGAGCRDVASGRSPDCSAGYLLAGQRLADYEAWIGRTTLDLTEQELEFVQRSIAARDDADRGETERAP